jgi:hypothetical protein
MKWFFLDASALAKRYVAEPGTPLLDYLVTNPDCAPSYFSDLN